MIDMMYLTGFFINEIFRNEIFAKYDDFFRLTDCKFGFGQKKLVLTLDLVRKKLVFTLDLHKKSSVFALDLKNICIFAPEN